MLKLTQYLLFLLLCFCFVLNAQTITELTLGQTKAFTSESAKYTYFKVHITNTQKDLTINVTPLGSGDPDIVASLGNSTTPLYPTLSDRQFSSLGWGEDSITIPYGQYNGQTDLYIGIFAVGNVNATIVAVSEGVITLVDGVPQGGSVYYNSIDSYEYTVPSVSGPCSISVNAIPLTGAVRLYMSTTGAPNPNDPSTYQYTSSRTYNGQGITVPSTDSRWPSTGKFYISVYGVIDSSYTVYASLNATNTILRDNLPFSEQLNVGQSAFFKYNLLSADCSLTVAVTSISGDPDLFISMTEQHPSASSYQWRSANFGNDTISITRPAQMGTYYISVVAWRATLFTLVASSKCGDGINYISLPDGVPLQGTLVERGVAYYRYIASNRYSDIVFSLSRSYGDPDLYITIDGSTPNTTNWQYRSIHFGDDLIQINSGDYYACPKAPAKSCVIKIAVVAVTTTSYSIQGHSDDAILLLRDGIPASDFLVAGKYDYYQFPVYSFGQSVVISVTDLGTGDPDLFISTVSHYPNRTSNQWASQRVRGDTIIIPPTDPNYCTFCTYYIGVMAFTNTHSQLLQRHNQIFN